MNTGSQRAAAEARREANRQRNLFMRVSSTHLCYESNVPRCVQVMNEAVSLPNDVTVVNGLHRPSVKSYTSVVVTVSDVIKSSWLVTSHGAEAGVLPGDIVVEVNRKDGDRSSAFLQY